jgi:RHS repeat-associated protein
VGGLLELLDANSGVSYFALSDANGNVAGLVNATTGTSAASYEYGAFGKPIQTTGVAVTLNPFRFSSKYTDSETDELYYGQRYYNPSTGRWLSRDPIEEQGGKNLYGFVANNAVNYTDLLGRALNPFNPDFGGTPFLVEDLGDLFRREGGNASGAVTITDWPDVVATATGNSVTVQGSLSVRFEIDTLMPSPSALGVDGIPVQEHEYLHGIISATFWNGNLDVINAYEGTYCRPGCAQLAADAANQLNLYRKYLQQAANSGFDVSQYGQNPLAQSYLRDQNFGQMQFWQARATQAKFDAEDAVKRYPNSSCAKTNSQ